METGIIGKISSSITHLAGFNTYENASQSYYAIRVYYQDLKYTLID
jgi:hypothetical protein